MYAASSQATGSVQIPLRTRGPDARTAGSIRDRRDAHTHAPIANGSSCKHRSVHLVLVTSLSKDARD